MPPPVLQRPITGHMGGGLPTQPQQAQPQQSVGPLSCGPGPSGSNIVSMEQWSARYPGNASVAAVNQGGLRPTNQNSMMQPNANMNQQQQVN